MTCRQPINKQRRALCKWWFNSYNNKKGQREATAWWEDKFGWKLAPSTCSDILSTKWAYLDKEDPSITRPKPAIKHNCVAKWPTLEAALI